MNNANPFGYAPFGGRLPFIQNIHPPPSVQNSMFIAQNNLEPRHLIYLERQQPLMVQPVSFPMVIQTPLHLMSMSNTNNEYLPNLQMAPFSNNLHKGHGETPNQFVNGINMQGPSCNPMPQNEPENIDISPGTKENLECIITLREDDQKLCEKSTKYNRLEKQPSSSSLYPSEKSPHPPESISPPILPVITENKTKVEILTRRDSDMEISDSEDTISETEKIKDAAALEKEIKAFEQFLNSERCSPITKKTVKKNQERKKEMNLNPTNVTNLEEYYFTLETPANYSKATTQLLELHDEIEELCKKVNSNERTERINKFIPNNTDYKKHLCECSPAALKKGIHHNVYPGEKPLDPCNPLTNNSDILYHYKLIIEPEYNFRTKRPSTVYFDGKEFHFEGFSLFSHSNLDEMPPYTFKRNLFEYSVTIKKQNNFPQEFCLKDLNLISNYLFRDLFELDDWDFLNEEFGCAFVHFMPLFVCKIRSKQRNGHPIFKLLPMAELLKYLIESYTPFYDSKEDWVALAKANRGCIVTNRTKSPRCIRCDQVEVDCEQWENPKLKKRRRKKDKDCHKNNKKKKKENDYKDDESNSKKNIREKENLKETFPKFIHSSALSTVSIEKSKNVRSATAELYKMKRKIRSRTVLSKEEQKELFDLQVELDRLLDERKETKILDIDISTEDFFHTGLRWDVCQHSSYLHGLWKYLKFMHSLHILEKKIGYTFKDKSLLKAALTLPSFQDQSSMSYCTLNNIHNNGKKAPEINFQRQLQERDENARKRGAFNTARVMATLLDKNQTKSSCQHNERLEFLGDAILDYLATLHLFLMFPDKEAGRLTQYRTGIVQMDNLYQIAEKLNVGDFLLFSHHKIPGEELTLSEMRKEYYLSNALEAIIGAVYLDGGINVVDNMLSKMLFSDDQNLYAVWKNPKKHPLQVENPFGDRDMIKNSEVLQKMVELEKFVGVKFRNIRLLAKSFTHSLLGLPDPKLTGGDYNRLEFLGDAILKYVTSDYLYKHFPKHQEGHLSLLRISLVNANCLKSAAIDLGLQNFIIYESSRAAKVTKDKIFSDVYEAFIGALHIDRCSKGLRYCQKMIEVSILSRLKEFIINQEWLDPKSLLQQCCSSLRNHDNEVVYPTYVCEGSEVKHGIHSFRVSVHYKRKKMGTGTGRSIKEAEKEAAREALSNTHFEEHARQKRLIYKTFGQTRRSTEDDELEILTEKENEAKISNKNKDQTNFTKHRESDRNEFFLAEPYEWGS